MVAWFAVFTLCGISDVKAQAPATPLTVQTLSNQLTTPEDIARFIWRNFRVESDRVQFGREEHWQSPEELLSNQKGDCEDFALFASQILKSKGVTAFLVNVYGDKFAHTVCIFKENGKFHVLDGDTVKRCNADNLTDIFSKIYPFWKEAAIVAYCSPSDCGRILKTFKNE